MLRASWVLMTNPEGPPSQRRGTRAGSGGPGEGPVVQVEEKGIPI